MKVKTRVNDLQEEKIKADIPSGTARSGEGDIGAIAVEPGALTGFGKYAEEDLYVASQWKLMWLKFKAHKLARISMIVLILLYFQAIFADFLSPYNYEQRHSAYIHCPPVKLHFVDVNGRFHLRPFVYDMLLEVDQRTLRKHYSEDKEVVYRLSLFVRGEPYEFLGLFETERHFFGFVGDEGEMGYGFPFGTDRMGRCMFSRILYGSRISLTIGLVGIVISLVIGLFFGGISGYFGGWVDNVIQRVIEIIKSFPSIPLWMALSAAIPTEWPPLFVYFGITVILSFIGWTGLARVVRSKFLALREEDFTMAAEVMGAGDLMIIRRHLIPGFLSYIIVSMTMSVPGMILGETSMSFLGLGLRPPMTSWGVLLKEAQNISSLVLNPWLVIPVFYVIVTVLAFNFLGDGLRDAADPYK